LFITSIHRTQPTKDPLFSDPGSIKMRLRTNRVHRPWVSVATVQASRSRKASDCSFAACTCNDTSASGCSPEGDGRKTFNSAVVTGAAQGVGLVTASHLARLGYRVILTDIQSLESHLHHLRAAGLYVDGASGDVSSEPFVRQLAELVHRDFGAADVLVNNAGVSLIAPAEDTTAAQWQRVMNINLLGPFLLCKYLGAKMLERCSGSIVNVASVAGLAGISHRSAYNASKHALIGLTRTLAAEWGGRGIRVNAVCPGWIKTEMDVADQGSGAYTDKDIINRVPMARFARPEDVAAAIAFLADSDMQGFINGVSLPVDGGWVADASWDALRISTRAL
jgi:NAD(P)-dependent dehydrogenase (short-subunit alcohol dehydrogenase family)